MLLSCPCSDESVCGVGRRYATAALSGAPRQLSQRESHWRAGRVSCWTPEARRGAKGRALLQRAGPSSYNLSVSADALPPPLARGGFGRPGNFLLDARGPIGRKRAGLATEGRRFWTSAPCQAVAGLDSGALPFPRHRALLVQTKADRHANGSPFGGAGAKRLRGQGCCQTALHCDSIALTKSLPIAAQRLFRAGLALSVCCADTSPIGRGFGRPGHFLLYA